MPKSDFTADAQAAQKQKHTPGPWLREGMLVYALEHYRWWRGEEQFRNRFWASVQAGKDTPLEEQEANARLMEAAPDLLEALKQALDYMSPYCPNGPCGKCEACIDAAKMEAAIAKATGAAQ